MFQDVIDSLVVLALFYVRIGVPIIVTLGVGIWREKKLRLAVRSRTLVQRLVSDFYVERPLADARSRAAAVVLALYLLARFVALIARGAIGYTFKPVST
ncbi:MAG: hypothetical protein AB1817_14140 [Chloroflexota bacterium]